MKRSNSYEAAFEGYLQWHRLCYVAVDETRRCCLGADFVKNLDFIVHGECGSRLLVDVKGRRYPGGKKPKKRFVWENWATAADIDGLLRWQAKFGPDYHALLVYVYHLGTDRDVSAIPGDLWTWRGRRYYLRAILAEEYARSMQTRSPRWATVSLNGKVFRELAKPFHFFTQDFQPSDVRDCPF